MRSVVVVVVFVAACSFRSGQLSNDTSGDAAIDAAPPRCIAAWCRRKSLTLPGVVGGPHVDFPVAIDLDNDAELAASARMDGHDLMFTDSAGNQLAYERVAFAKTTGRLLAWVKVPSLSAGTMLYLYYGNPNATDQQAATQTWSAGYQGVWHFEEASGSVFDASGHGNTGSGNSGVVLGAAGPLGQAAKIDHTVGGILTIPKSASLDSTAAEGTFELMVNWTVPMATGDHQLLMSSSNRWPSPDNGFEWGSQSGGNHYFYPWPGPSQGDYNLGGCPYSAGTWQHAAVTLDFSTKTVLIYVDGVAMNFTDINVPTMWTTVANPGDWLWGGNPAYGGGTLGFFDGKIDEIRISNVVRSADWIATEAANQRMPAAFATIGPEEVLHP